MLLQNQTRVFKQITQLFQHFFKRIAFGLHYDNNHEKDIHKTESLLGEKIS